MQPVQQQQTADQLVPRQGIDRRQACRSGLRELLQHAFQPRAVQILERAREARYVQFEVNRGLPAPYLVKYFKREGLDWQLKDEIRNMVKFRRFDLRQPMTGLGVFDIVFCWPIV